MKEIYKSELFLITEDDSSTNIGTPVKTVSVKRLSDGATLVLPSDIGGLDSIFQYIVSNTFVKYETKNPIE